MTKKDYELIAQALIRAQGHITLAHDEQTKPEVLYQWICKEVGDTLHDSNYRFDKQKFLTACGIESSYTIKPADVGKRFIELQDKTYSLSDSIGYIQKIDVGRKLTLKAGLIYMS